MKKLFKIIPFILFAINSKAQNPIIDIIDANGHPIQGAYYKDINNFLNQFEGTFLYTNGATSLKIILQKKTMNYDGFRYEDLLVGEYQYIENGTEKINTLNILDEEYINRNQYSIEGNHIIQFGHPRCKDCVPNEIRFRGGIVEKSTQNGGFITIKKIIVNGQSAIKLIIGWDIRVHSYGEPELLNPSFQSDQFIMIKQ